MEYILNHKLLGGEELLYDEGLHPFPIVFDDWVETTQIKVWLAYFQHVLEEQVGLLK